MNHVLSGSGLSDGSIPRPERSPTHCARMLLSNTQRLKRLDRKDQTKKIEAKICNYCIKKYSYVEAEYMQNFDS